MVSENDHEEFVCSCLLLHVNYWYRLNMWRSILRCLNGLGFDSPRLQLYGDVDVVGHIGNGQRGFIEGKFRDIMPNTHRKRCFDGLTLKKITRPKLLWFIWRDLLYNTSINSYTVRIRAFPNADFINSYSWHKIDRIIVGVTHSSISFMSVGYCMC